jgi:hypothetical protein
MVVCGTPSPAQDVVLANSHVSASFGSRGMLSIRAFAGDVPIAFSKDEWALAIDHVRLSSEDAGQPRRTSNEHEIAYTFEQNGYKVQAVYRLEESWDFVSKQLTVLTAPKRSFTVESVSLLDFGLAQPVDSSFVPTTYLPHFLISPKESKDRIETSDYGIFLRYPRQQGLMLLVQNPFLHVKQEPHGVTLNYLPDMGWDNAWGSFSSDIACIGPYRQTENYIAAQLVREWEIPQTPVPASANGADRAEVEAFTAAVRAFVIHPAPQPISVEVGWTLNDYQIDIGTPEGLAEYKRLIDSTAELGIANLLYTGADSKVALMHDDTDTWRAEHLLWLDLGQGIREGKWDPDSSHLPAEVGELLDYAKSKNVKLLAYVYPSLPFAQDKSWLAMNKWKEYQEWPSASLASRAFQDFLIKELLTFKKRTGIGGYSFDYAFLNLSGSSAYAQWNGWRRVLESLRRADPNIVIDGRQTYQMFGPWSWLGGSYPHPSGSDEQAESFMPFPDLHFDRVSADRIRFVNYWYRNYEFAPQILIPGYTTHQTERSRNIPPDSETGGHPQRVETSYTRYRPRDWDYLGYRYSFLSSIATGGWNNVVNMIPSRDPEEAKHFSEQDKAWIRQWLQWTVEHKEYLLHTRTILGQPAVGKLDGTAAIIKDHGYLFLFNPNYRRLTAHLRLDSSIGLTSGTHFLLKEVDPQNGRRIGKPGAGIWSYGDEVELPLDGTSATVLEIVPYIPQSQPLIFNAARNTHSPTTHVDHGRMEVDWVVGEPGTVEEVGVLLPQAHTLHKVQINGAEVPFDQKGNYIAAHVHFSGERFAKAEQVSLSPSVDGALQGTFQVPARVHEQMVKRQQAWPIPWTKEDYETTWLAPGRLLLFVQMADPKDDEEIHLNLDGKLVHLLRAYTSVRVHQRAFVGLYADVSDITLEVPHKLEVRLPAKDGARFQGIFFDNVEPDWTEKVGH